MSPSHGIAIAVPRYLVAKADAIKRKSGAAAPTKPHNQTRRSAIANAVEEEKTVATKTPGEIASRVEGLEHWMEHFMDDLWRRQFPILFGRDRWLPIRSSSIRMPSLDVYEE